MVWKPPKLSRGRALRFPESVTVTETDSSPSSGPLLPRRTLGGLRPVLALILREMSTRYGRSPGGYVWAIVEPVGAIVILAVAFSIVVRTPPLGNSFVLFFASGFLPFTLYASVQVSVQYALGFSKPLLVFPAVSWIDAVLARFILNALTGTLVVSGVFAGVVVATETAVILDPVRLIAACALAILLGFGIGCLNCALTGLYPVWAQIWGIVHRPLFLIAGVLFTFESLPDTAQTILWGTPWLHITAVFRSGVYPTYHPDYLSVGLVLAWALVPMALGLLLLRRHHQDILMR